MFSGVVALMLSATPRRGTINFIKKGKPLRDKYDIRFGLITGTCGI
jgi:hypothetical protein